MRLARLALILLLASNYAHATWSFIQWKGASCTGTSNSCAVTTLSPAIAAGDVIVVMIGVGINETIQTIADNGSTFVIPSACVSEESVSGVNTSCGYSLAAVGGATTVTVTRNTSTSTNWQLRVGDFHSTTTVAYDTAAITTASTATASPVGPSLTLTGTNDLVVQMIRGSNITAISAPYTLGSVGFGSNNVGYVLNSSTAPAPTWTQTSTRTAMSAIAIMEGGAVQPVIDVITENRFP